jgi:hypothetical protein
MAPEGSGGRELAQLVTHHVLADVDGDMPASIVNSDRMTDHLRENGRCPRPGLDNTLAHARTIHLFDSSQ